LSTVGNESWAGCISYCLIVAAPDGASSLKMLVMRASLNDFAQVLFR
jgi:hypothetical protein